MRKGSQNEVVLRDDLNRYLTELGCSQVVPENITCTKDFFQGRVICVLNSDAQQKIMASRGLQETPDFAVVRNVTLSKGKGNSFLIKKGPDTDMVYTCYKLDSNGVPVILRGEGKQWRFQTRKGGFVAGRGENVFLKSK